MRKTLAILGDAGEFLPEVMKGLMQQDLQLLFVSEDDEKNSDLMAGLGQTEAIAEVEFTSCERDGCWEADIIVITQPGKFSSALLERLKEVATQKVVLAVYDNKLNLDNSLLQQLLSHSKVVLLLVDSQEKKFSVFGNDPEAGDRVQKLFSGAGYDFTQ